VAAVADCERLHDGLLDQPVNALSSVAYVAAGMWVWRHDRIQGAALVAVGVGSIAYHGFGGSVAHWLHDSTIVVVAIVAATAAPRIWRRARARPVLATCAVGAFALALPLQVFGRTGGPWCRPDSVLQAHAGWHVLTATALACAFVAADRREPQPAMSDRTRSSRRS
jgi:hypothetical protein